MVAQVVQLNRGPNVISVSPAVRHMDWRAIIAGQPDPAGISGNGDRMALGGKDRRVHVEASARQECDAAVAILSEGHRLGESDGPGVSAGDEGGGLRTALQ